MAERLLPSHCPLYLLTLSSPPPLHSVSAPLVLPLPPWDPSVVIPAVHRLSPFPPPNFTSVGARARRRSRSSRQAVHIRPLGTGHNIQGALQRRYEEGEEQQRQQQEIQGTLALLARRAAVRPHHERAADRACAGRGERSARMCGRGTALATGHCPASSVVLGRGDGVTAATATTTATSSLYSAPRVLARSELSFPLFPFGGGRGRWGQER